MIGPRPTSAALLDPLRDLARDQLVERLNAILPGELAVGAIEGSPFGDLSLLRVTLHYEGAEILSVPRATANLRFTGLVGGDIVLERLELERPRVRLRQDAEGNWNLLAALVEQAEPATTPTPQAQEQDSGGFPLAIDVIEVDGGHLEITPFGEQRRTYDVTDLRIGGRLRLGAQETEARIDELAATLAGPGVPATAIDAARISYETQAAGAVRVENLQLRTEQSAVVVDGRVTDLASPHIDATVDVRPLAAADASALVADWPLATPVHGTLSVRGPLADLRAEAQFASAEARVSAEAHADLSQDTPTFSATLTAHGVRPEQLVPEYDIAGAAHGRAQLAGSGGDVSTLSGSAAIAVADLRAAGMELGDAQFDATLDAGQLAISGDLHRRGRARFEGSLGLESERYRAHLVVDGLRAAATTSQDASFDSSINLEAHIDGQGFAADQAEVNARVAIAPSVVGPVEVDTGHVNARLAGGRLTIHEARLAAAGATATVAGQLGLSGAGEGRLEYDVRAPRLAPWLTLAGRKGGGAIELHGVAAGALQNLDTSGTVRLADVVVDGNSVGSGTARFELSRIGTAEMSGVIEAELSDIEAGLALARLEAGVDLRGTDPLVASFDIDARALENRPQAIDGELTVGAEQTEVRLQRVALDVPGGIWQLTSPARIVYGGDGVSVESLRLRNGAQTLEVDGGLGSEPGNSLRVVAARIDLGVVNAYAPDAVSDVQGILAADLRVGGTLTAPQPSGSLTLVGGRAAIEPLGITMDDLVARIDADPNRIDVVELTARSGQGTLDVAGTVQLRDGSPGMALQVRADDWPALATQRAEARIDASIAIGGTLAAPDVRGDVSVLQAVLRPELAMLTESSGPAPRDPTIVVLQEQRAAAQAAARKSESALDLTEALRGLALELRLDVSDDTWIKHDDASLGLFGQLTARKPSGGDISLVGSIRVVQGWIYFRGRRFNPREGEVIFTGGREIDPSLDVVLETRVAGYTVQAIVGGRASEPTLDFESQPQLADADILSLLLFGRRVNQLDSGEQVALEQQAGSMAANFAAGRLAEAISDQLGLGLVITEVDVIDGGVGVGRYITPDTFVSVSQELGGTAEREVSIDYYLNPQWSLSTSTDTGGESTADVFWRWEY